MRYTCLFYDYIGGYMGDLKEVTPVNNQQVIELAKSDFLSVSVDNKVVWQKECRFAMQLLKSNEYLDGVAWDNPQSLRDAIVNVSAIGISLNPASKHAYLVPRKKNKSDKISSVCLDISYMGLLHLACMSGSIMWGQAKIVRENDKYISNGVGKEPDHIIENVFDMAARGGIVGAYCTVKTRDGDFLTEEMSINQIYDIRDRSMAFKKNSGPWTTDPEQMIRKTVVKRASSYWPKVDRLDSAIQMLNNDNEEGIDFDSEKPKGKSGNWRAGNNPDSLPDALRQVFLNAKEAYDMGDFQVVCEIMSSFGLNEEKIAVWKCFASDERAAITKFLRSDQYVEVVNMQRVDYLSGKDLDDFLERFN